MSIENILESDNIDQIVAFLSAFIPMLTYDNNYQESNIDFNKITEKVQEEPKFYLDLVCVPVAEQLREKNIFSIGSLKTDEYIYLLLDRLSQDNRKIFSEKFGQNNTNYFISTSNLHYFGLRVKNNNNNLEQEFLNLISDFKMQDIQRGFFNEKNFLMNICNCEKVEGLKESRKSDAQIVFDIQKMDKSFKEYLKDSGYEQYYVQDEHRVYLNDFYYNAHKNYLNGLKNVT